MRARIAVLALALVACSSSRPAPSPTNSASVPSASPTATRSTFAAADGDWTAYHHDLARSGIASDQRPLGRVHRAWVSPPLDASVYAQPLVMGNFLYVATERNSVYALDRTTGKIAWRRPLGTPVDGGTLPCGNIDPSGITGTPVIDPSAKTLYTVAFLRPAHHVLFALDIANGQVRWQHGIDPPGLSARVEQQRGALALSHGRIYVPYGGLQGDCGSYKGAVVSFPANGRGALDAYIVPTEREGGIWTPTGPAVDPTGDLWVVTGNTVSQGAFDYGNALIRLTPGLEVRDWFAPANWARLNAGDVDLGSVGTYLLGGNRAYTAGKSGLVYLLDRSDLGHIGGQIASTHGCSRAFGAATLAGSVIVQPCEDALVGIRVGARSLDRVWTRFGASGPAILAGGAVWSIGYDGTLRALDPRNGNVRYADALGEHVSRFESPSAAYGMVFAPAGSRVVAFAIR